MHGKRVIWALGIVAACVAAVAGLARAGALSIGAGGTINGCYQVANGNLRVVETGSACRGGEQAISWAKEGTQGPAGPPGPVGPAGPAGHDGRDGSDGAAGQDGRDGANGVSVTSAQVAAGDANCPNGGSQFTAANGVTYACNGADGTGGNGAPPAAIEATDGGSLGFVTDGAYALLNVPAHSLVTGTLSVSFLPDNQAADTVRCAIRDESSPALTEIGVATVGSPFGANGGIASVTMQGLSGVGAYDIKCRRVSGAGLFAVLSPKLTAIAVS